MSTEQKPKIMMYWTSAMPSNDNKMFWCSSKSGVFKEITHAFSGRDTKKQKNSAAVTIHFGDGSLEGIFERQLTENNNVVCEAYEVNFSFIK